MKAILAGGVALVLVFSGVPPTLPGDDLSPGGVISEDEARTISAGLYSAILIKACKNGWRYPLRTVKSGFKHHFSEFKLQLANNGYTIVPGRGVNDGSQQQQVSSITTNDHPAPRFGCARQYWLDKRR